MPDRNLENGRFVTPGDKLVVIEEFLPGIGTYIDDGNIYSLITGHLKMDPIKREVSVQPAVVTPSIPKKGDIVIGYVVNIQDRNLVIKIFQINNQTTPNFTGIMHVSDVSRDYVKTMFDAFKVGDIVRAKVISTVNREVHLSTQSNDLGVVQAFCSHCGNLLTLQNNPIKCSKCKKIERRKIAFNYQNS